MRANMKTVTMFRTILILSSPRTRVSTHYFSTLEDVGNSVSAVAFFEGRLYAADYSKKCLWFFESDSSGSPDLTKPRIIAEGMGAEFVDLVR